MSNNRMQRVEETLRRGVADVLLFGGVRDPRLQGVNFSVTGVKVDTELTLARVFVDLLSPDRDRPTVLAGLRAAAGVIRRELKPRVQLRRIPELRFEYDESIETGLRIEKILGELSPKAPAAANAATDAAVDTDDTDDADDADDTDDAATDDGEREPDER